MIVSLRSLIAKWLATYSIMHPGDLIKFGCHANIFECRITVNTCNNCANVLFNKTHEHHLQIGQC